MPVVVVTRTVIGRPRHVLPFGWRSLRAAWQTRRSPGYLGGRMAVTSGPAFWTVTAWADGRAMTAFRDSGTHADSMPLLYEWASEGAVAVWRTTGPRVPTWAEAVREFAGRRRIVPVTAPSPDQQRGIVRPHRGPRLPLPIPALRRGRTSPAAPSPTAVRP